MSAISTALDHAFESKRLRYIAVEDDCDDYKAVLKDMMNEAPLQALSSEMILRPQGSTDVQFLATMYRKALLGVAICLGPSEEAARDESTSESQAQHGKKPAAPTIIGTLCIGWGGIPDSVRHNRNAYLGITLARPFRGRGYGREALDWGVDWAFRHGGLHSLSLTTVSCNEVGQRLYAAAGFTEPRDGQTAAATINDLYFLLYKIIFPISAVDFQDCLYELFGCISAPVPEFIDKYFGNARVASKATAPESSPSTKASPIQPASVDPESFPQWFVNFAQANRSGARGSWSVSAKDDTHHERGLMSECTHLAFRVKDDAAVQVVGLVCPMNASYRDGLIALCASAQAVFYQQPTRLFLHGFYIRGSLVELWVLDRSGVYCSEAMNVGKDAEQFLSLFQYYESMADQELGMSSIFSIDAQGQYILLDENNDMADRLYIDTTPIVTRQTLIGAATVVYRARLSGSDEWSHAVKIKWPSANARPEHELLERAMEKKAWGAANLVLFRQFETTANLRRGMGCGKQRKLPLEVTAADEQNNKTEVDNDDAPGVLQFTEETWRFFDNRALVCVVTSPLGRPLDTFQTRLELLEALRDAIKCHRSLYLDAGLLHGDISPGNMIIADTAGAGQPRGMLIDLEFAMPRDPAPERDPNVTIGTQPFMAIGYMNGEAKTYRQDLEAFFYVLLHMVVGHRDTMKLPEESRMRAWAQGGGSGAGSDAWCALAEHKLRDMEEHSFRRIVDEIPPAFAAARDLAERLRALLFPVRDGKVWAGTDHTPQGVETLYDGVISAFEDAVAAESQCL